MSKSFLNKLMDKLRYGSEKEFDDDPEQILTTEKPAAEQTKDNDEAVFEEKVDNHSELSAYKNAKKEMASWLFSESSFRKESSTISIKIRSRKLFVLRSSIIGENKAKQM